MKKTLLLIISIILVYSVSSQISYDNSDMPTPGDTFRTSTALTVGTIDFTLTGNNYIWNFSNLTPISQNLDTFVAVSSTPFVYQYYFNNQLVYPNYKATVASSEDDIESIPGFTISKVYNFYKNSSATHQLVGIGGVFSGIPFPVQFSGVDVIYKFPITPTSIPDSCISSYDVTVPNIAYVSQIKHRKNIVDGWGSLTTPYGTFPNVIRIKSIIHQKDSFYLDSIGLPIPAIETDIIEYKWLAKNYGIPVLQINATMGVASNITYFDVYRNLLSIGESDLQKSNLTVSPNPTTNNIKITYNCKSNHKIVLELIDINGKIILQKSYYSGVNDELNLIGFKKGIYLIRLINNEVILHRKIIVQ